MCCVLRGLDQVNVGSRVVVSEVLPCSSYGRLMDFGFLPGTIVEVVRVAPLGDPMEVEVRGAYLAIRKSEAKRILVKYKVGGDAC